VSLTRDGKRLADAVHAERVTNEESLLGEFGTRNRNELARLLELLALTFGDDVHVRQRGARSARLKQRRVVR
jgi:hypothetical protein